MHESVNVRQKAQYRKSACVNEAKHYIRTSTSTSMRTWAHTESWLSRSLLTSPSSRLPLLQRVSNSLTVLLLSMKVRDNLEPQLETAVHCRATVGNVTSHSLLTASHVIFC